MKGRGGAFILSSRDLGDCNFIILASKVSASRFRQGPMVLCVRGQSNGIVNH